MDHTSSAQTNTPTSTKAKKREGENSEDTKKERGIASHSAREDVRTSFADNTIVDVS
jgi:hypothetical protein